MVCPTNYVQDCLYLREKIEKTKKTVAKWRLGTKTNCTLKTSPSYLRSWYCKVGWKGLPREFQGISHTQKGNKKIGRNQKSDKTFSINKLQTQKRFFYCKKIYINWRFWPNCLLFLESQTRKHKIRTYYNLPSLDKQKLIAAHEKKPDKQIKISVPAYLQPSRLSVPSSKTLICRSLCWCF